MEVSEKKRERYVKIYHWKSLYISKKSGIDIGIGAERVRKIDRQKSNKYYRAKCWII